MKKHNIIIGLALFNILIYRVPIAYAEENHNHSAHEEGHSPSSKKESDDHSTNEGEHSHSTKKENREHSNKKEEHGHSGHKESSSEYVKTTISPGAAKKAGIQSTKANSKIINEKIILTGRIILNRNKTYPIRARYPGPVTEMLVSLGEKVKKGQVLAKIDSNQSLQIYSIVAPQDGIILETNTNVGDVAGEEPLFTVADLSSVWAEFHIFQRDINKVSVGQKIKLRTLETGKHILTTVSMLLPTADELSQTVIAIVNVDNNEGIWRPGLTVEGDLEINKKEVKVAVAKKAVQRMENKNVVFVKNGDSEYIAKEVDLGIDDGEYIEVLTGLGQGQEYIIGGSFRVKADILKSTAEHTH